MPQPNVSKRVQESPPINRFDVYEAVSGGLVFVLEALNFRPVSVVSYLLVRICR